MFSASQSSGIVSSPLCSKGKGYQLGDELNVDRSVRFRDTEMCVCTSLCVQACVYKYRYVCVYTVQT